MSRPTLRLVNVAMQRQAAVFSARSTTMANPSQFARANPTVRAPLSTSFRWFSDSKDEEKKEEKQEEKPAEESKEEEAAEEPQPSREEALEEEVKNLKDQLLRSLAEQENTRNIARRDVQEARQFAIKSFAKSLLEVSDNLERALESVPEELLAGDDVNPQLHSLHQGVEMTNAGLIKAFQSNGVTKFCEKPGEKFNPELMNALMQYPDPEKEPDTVGQVIKAGFMLNDRVLRPAEVGVIKKP